MFNIDLSKKQVRVELILTLLGISADNIGEELSIVPSFTKLALQEAEQHYKAEEGQKFDSQLVKIENLIANIAAAYEIETELFDPEITSDQDFWSFVQRNMDELLSAKPTPNNLKPDEGKPGLRAV